MSEATMQAVMPAKEDKTYILRTLEASDIFAMSKILNAIGVKELKSIIPNKPAAANDEDAVAKIGMEVFFDIAGIVIGNLPKCEKDVYAFISSLSDMDEEEIKHLPMDTFVNIIIDIVKKDEFKDFITVVSALFK